MAFQTESKEYSSKCMSSKTMEQAIQGTVGSMYRHARNDNMSERDD